jgi:hypothetical protein
MKKTLSALAILFCLLANTNNLTAKNDSTSLVKNGIGLSFAPMYLLPTNNNGNNLFGSSNTTRSTVGTTVAICQNIVLSKKQNLYLYTELGGQTNINSYTATQNSQSTNINVYSSVKLIDRTHYAYFSLSLQKVLFSVSKKVGLFAGIGAQINYCLLTSEKLDETFTYGGQTQTNNYSSTNNNIPSQNRKAASGIARIGVLISPVKNLAINLAPVFYYALNPTLVFKQNNISYNSLGLNLQILYSF